MTRAEWMQAGTALFGADTALWRFRCPACGYVASVKDWRNAGAEEGMIAFSCIGRLRPSPRDAFMAGGPGPCNYAGGGLFRLNPVDVDGERVFAFAESALEAS